MEVDLRCGDTSELADEVGGRDAPRRNLIEDVDVRDSSRGVLDAIPGTGFSTSRHANSPPVWRAASIP
jgi:hypothetical protein